MRPSHFAYEQRHRQVTREYTSITVENFVLMQLFVLNLVYYHAYLNIHLVPSKNKSEIRVGIDLKTSQVVLPQTCKNRDLHLCLRGNSGNGPAEIFKNHNIEYAGATPLKYSNLTVWLRYEYTLNHACFCSGRSADVQSETGSKWEGKKIYVTTWFLVRKEVVFFSQKVVHPLCTISKQPHVTIPL